MISVQHLETYRYQKVLDVYEVGYIDWSSKDLDAIETYLVLIDQLRGIIKPPYPIVASVVSIYN